MAKPLTAEQKAKKKLADAARYQHQKEQIKARVKAWKDSNREHVLENKKQYRKENAEKIAEYSEKNKDRYFAYRESRREEANSYAKQYREQNKEAISEKRREKYFLNPETVKTKQKEWYAANKDRAREYKRWHMIARKDWHVAYAHTKRARKKQGVGKLSDGIVQVLMTEQDHKCPYCLVDLRISGHHIDHYVPLALGGPNQDDNVQLTCPTCNARKGAKHPSEFLNNTVKLK
jgi:5-methylcytosine-specific restriction endonuclease McrA